MRTKVRKNKTKVQTRRARYDKIKVEYKKVMR